MRRKSLMHMPGTSRNSVSAPTLAVARSLAQGDSSPGLKLPSVKGDSSDRDPAPSPIRVPRVAGVGKGDAVDAIRSPFEVRWPWNGEVPLPTWRDWCRYLIDHTTDTYARPPQILEERGNPTRDLEKADEEASALRKALNGLRSERYRLERERARKRDERGQMEQTLADLPVAGKGPEGAAEEDVRRRLAQAAQQLYREERFVAPALQHIVSLCEGFDPGNEAAVEQVESRIARMVRGRGRGCWRGRGD